MAREVAADAHVAWPTGIRLPVVLTFEHQSGEGVPPLPGNRPNFMMGGAVQYGARTGIWNILELLARYDVKATFFVCGATAEEYPDSIRAAHEAGHEIAGMSYGFERVRTMSFARERAIVRRTAKALRDVCGAEIKGWRCPDYRVSPQTLDVLAEEGFVWDSSHLNDDLPYLFECTAGRMIELPFSTSTADKTFIGYPYPQRGGPQGLADVWNSEFDVLYRESAQAPRLMMLSIQTWATGRPASLRVLEGLIERLARHNDVRFARCADIAGWCNGANGQ
ncbi:MAG TPA: polysaccharide deacetylase family protein [Xanthobacteraceae bacterium]|jgi:peptidoglycan/xylan/chitin deacetylase (PgdA/CDA1 family)|nr:polysaccharide deacetylase family protein [Xanthobacteraceae bacterium]